MTAVTTVAVIGAGAMGREHIRAFGALDDVSVVGIQSRTPARAEALARELNVDVVASDVRDLWERTRADLVVVAVPELEAKRVAEACFEHSWAVLLEKPAGCDLEEAEAIARAAAGRPAPVMVGLNRRFYASTLAVRRDLDSRQGRRFVRVQDQQSYAEARSHGHPERVVERFMYANSIHVIDYLTHLCRGEVTHVESPLPWRGESTDFVLAHVEFDSGDVGLYEGAWTGPGPWACAVATVTRRWVMQPLEQARYQDLGERRQHELPPDKSEVDFKPGLLRQAEQVVARVHGRESGAVTIDESLRTMRLIHRMFGV